MVDLKKTPRNSKHKVSGNTKKMKFIIIETHNQSIQLGPERRHE